MSASELSKIAYEFIRPAEKGTGELHVPRDNLSDDLSNWIMHIYSYLAQHKESYQVQKQLVDIRKAIAKLRDHIMTEQEDGA